MTGKDAFKIWAPAGARWADWARPVPFTTMQDLPGPGLALHFTIPDILYMGKAEGNVAVILDTPDCEGVQEGIAFAKLGFRPIPLYNGTSGQEGAMALVDSHKIASALQWGALELANITIPKDAPPVFLLDSNRMQRYKMDVSVFDNSWDIYDQDMPPAKYFLQSGINQIVVRGETIQKDLSRILYKLQKKGIAVFFTGGYDPPKKVAVKRPPRKRS